MAQVTKGLRSVLSLPKAYDLLMALLGAARSREIVVHQYLRISTGDRVLDIGCGTGLILDYLPQDIDYHGIDLSPQYIASAKSRFGARGHFQCCDVNQLELGGGEKFDVIMALGLLHHLDDDEVRKLVQSVGRLLATNGRFITRDNCFTDDQSVVARTLSKWDRGQNVRYPEAYRALLGEVFDHVACEVRHDLLRLPYSHTFLEATHSAPS